ncbi:hypothetical protein SE17_17495 [Kouleothrix aurantiaca]|uniref:Uncharacterized protein n=1 Tax=Kouleothrix aurantiaca TaxID=186479 RepID=A0A0P9D2A7_9CHLR|nr:hypothetical protein SE17_17495 [Kouleothrix aurantiaca]
MAGNQDLVGAGAGQHKLAIAQVAGRERRVDAHLVGAVGQRVEIPLAQAEAPLALIIAGAVGHPIGMLGRCEQVRAQLAQRQRALHRLAVVQHMQVRLAEIDHALAAAVFDIGVANIPLVGHQPVEHGRARRNLMQRQRHVFLQDAQGFAHARAGDAAADRVEPRDQGVHRRAGIRADRRVSLSAHGRLTSG